MSNALGEAIEKGWFSKIESGSLDFSGNNVPKLSQMLKETFGADDPFLGFVLVRKPSKAASVSDGLNGKQGFIQRKPLPNANKPEKYCGKQRISL